MLFFEKRKVHQPECGQIPRQRGYPMFPTQIHEKIKVKIHFSMESHSLKQHFSTFLLKMLIRSIVFFASDLQRRLPSLVFSAIVNRQEIRIFVRNGDDPEV